MTKSKAVPASRPARRALRVCLLAAGFASFALPASILAQGSTQPGQTGGGGSGAGTSSTSSATSLGAAQTQLYNASGSNGAQVTQDTYKGSIVSGKSTGTLLDLSLEDSIQRAASARTSVSSWRTPLSPPRTASAWNSFNSCSPPSPPLRPSPSSRSIWRPTD